MKIIVLYRYARARVIKDRHITTESMEAFLVAIERAANAMILVQFSQKQNGCKTSDVQAQACHTSKCRRL